MALVIIHSATKTSSDVYGMTVTYRERLLYHLDYWRANPYGITGEPCGEKEGGLAPRRPHSRTQVRSLSKERLDLLRACALRCFCSLLQRFFAHLVGGNISAKLL